MRIDQLRCLDKHEGSQHFCFGVHHAAPQEVQSQGRPERMEEDLAIAWVDGILDES